jgi:hypothetical protein
MIYLSTTKAESRFNKEIPILSMAHDESSVINVRDDKNQIYFFKRKLDLNHSCQILTIFSVTRKMLTLESERFALST